MTDSEAELDSLLAESEYTQNNEENYNRSRAHGIAGSMSDCDSITKRKPLHIIQYESNEIGHYKTHASSRMTRRLRSFLLFMCVATVLTIFTYLTVSVQHASRIGILPGWGLNRSRHIPVYILPGVSTTLIDPLNVCDGTGTLFLLIFVCSSPDNFQKRQTIRETWANVTEFNYPEFAKMHANFNGAFLPINASASAIYAIQGTGDPSNWKFRVKIVFLIGQTESNVTQMRIDEESDAANDLIQESFLDSYNNLTLKTVMMLKWVNDSCADKIQFLMKCDDDTFVNVPNLIHVLLGGSVPVYVASLVQYDERTFRKKKFGYQLRDSMAANVLMGHRFCRTKPIANASSKWYSPNYMYDKDTYPNYLSGTGYVMSVDVALRLYNASLRIPLFHLEDVFVTGICARAANVKPQNHPLFNFIRYKYLCEARGTVTAHQLTSTAMKKVYEFVRNPHEICHVPYAKKKLTPFKRVNHCG